MCWIHQPCLLSLCTQEHLLCCLLVLTFFCFPSVHGGKGIRYTANEDTPPEKGTCLQCNICMLSETAHSTHTGAQKRFYTKDNLSSVGTPQNSCSHGSVLIFTFSLELLLISEYDNVWLMQGLFMADKTYRIKCEDTESLKQQTSWVAECRHISDLISSWIYDFPDTVL